MRFAWKALVAFGVVLVAVAVGMDTTVQTGYGRVHNIGLQGHQQLLLILGCVTFLAGVILFALVKLKQTPEEATKEEMAYKARAAEVRSVASRATENVRRATGHVRLGKDRLLIRLAVGLSVGVLWSFFAYSVFEGAEVLAFLAAVGLALWPRPVSDVLTRLLRANAAIAVAFFLGVVAQMAARDQLTHTGGAMLFAELFATAIVLVAPSVVAAVAASWIARRKRTRA